MNSLIVIHHGYPFKYLLFLSHRHGNMATILVSHYDRSGSKAFALRAGGPGFSSRKSLQWRYTNNITSIYIYLIVTCNK